MPGILHGVGSGSANAGCQFLVGWCTRLVQSSRVGEQSETDGFGDSVALVAADRVEQNFAQHVCAVLVLQQQLNVPTGLQHDTMRFQVVC